MMSLLVVHALETTIFAILREEKKVTPPDPQSQYDLRTVLLQW